MRHLPQRRLRRRDQAAGRVEHEDVVGIEHGIEHLAGLEFVHAVQHRDPVGGVAM